MLHLLSAIDVHIYGETNSVADFMASMEEADQQIYEGSQHLLANCQSLLKYNNINFPYVRRIIVRE